MKIMIFKTRVEHLENVLNEIGNSNLYEYPHVDFVLVKEINGKDYYTAGISMKSIQMNLFYFAQKLELNQFPFKTFAMKSKNTKNCSKNVLKGMFSSKCRRVIRLSICPLTFILNYGDL